MSNDEYRDPPDWLLQAMTKASHVTYDMIVGDNPRDGKELDRDEMATVLYCKDAGEDKWAAVVGDTEGKPIFGMIVSRFVKEDTFQQVDASALAEHVADWAKLVFVKYNNIQDPIPVLAMWAIAFISALSQAATRIEYEDRLREVEDPDAMIAIFAHEADPTTRYVVALRSDPYQNTNSFSLPSQRN